MKIRSIAGWLVSPTFMLADRAKEAEKANHPDDEEKRKQAVSDLIKRRNSRNLFASIAIVAIIAVCDFVMIRANWILIDQGWLVWTLPMLILGILAWHAFSRACEVFWAFYKDAVHQTQFGNSNTNSSLKPWERVQLALKSYLELIFDFGIIYYFLSPGMLPSILDRDPNGFGPLISGLIKGPDVRHILESVYFSGITITTTGFGELHPTGIIPRFLSVFEVLTGILLLVVCFTLYAGGSKKGES